MKFKKIMLLAIFLVILLAVSAVSAADNATSDVVGVEETTDNVVNDNLKVSQSTDESFGLPVENDEILNGSQEEIMADEILAAEYECSLKDNHNNDLISNDDVQYTFEDLKDLINGSAENSEIKLEHDYVYNWSSGSYNEIEINITNGITLDGQGHDMSRGVLFNIVGENVTIKNLSIDSKFNSMANDCTFVNCIFSKRIYSDEGLTFVNCSFIGSSSGITSKKVNCKNCNFTDCFSKKGAVYTKDCNIVNCSFIKCVAEYSNEYCYGGAIHTIVGNITDSCFIGCNAFGGAIYGDNINCVNDEFINCSAANGGAIYAWSCNVSNSTFLHCFSYYKDPSHYVTEDGLGSAIFTNVGNISNSHFIDCSAGSGSVIDVSELISVNNEFINCHASSGAIHIASYSFHARIINPDDFPNSYDSYIFSRYVSRDRPHRIINCSFIGDSWFCEKGCEIYNVTVNNVIYDFSFFNLSKDNAHITLTKNYTFIGAPFLVSGNNIVIDGNGNYITSGELIRAFDILGTNVTIKNVNFIGGGIMSEGLNTSILNCSFLKNKDRTQPVLWFDDAAYGCNIIDCSFINGRISIDHYSKNINIIGCTFVKCYRAIIFYGIDGSYLSENSNINDCNFIDCENIAINFEYFSSNSNIFNCSFINHSGRIFDLYGSEFNIANCNFVNCSNSRLHIKGNSRILNCKFENSSAYNYGIIYCYYCDCSIINCTFKNNPDSQVVAAYFVSHNHASIINTSFEGARWYSDYPIELSNVTVDGVPVSLWDNLNDYSYVTLTKDFEVLYSPVAINKNNVVIDGNGHMITSTPNWALYITGKNVILKNIIFNGSNVYSSGTNLTLINCNFVNCSANREGVNFRDGKIINCNFTKCSAGSNGFLYQYNCVETISVVNCNFINGYAGSMVNAEKIDMVNTNFINCSKAILTSIPQIDNCTFVNCHDNYEDNYEGGAIFINGGRRGIKQILNSKFINCSSQKGGAISTSCRDLKITNCSFMDCYAECGGAIWWPGSDGNVSGCSFINNTALSNEAIYAVYDKITILLSDCYFTGGKLYSNFPNTFKFSNVTIDDKLYSQGLSDILEDNAKIELADNENIYSPILIKGNNVTIDGRGNIIEGCDNEAFYLTGKNITIKNVIFKHCAVYSKNINNKIINCTFINQNAYKVYQWDLITSSVYGFDGVINCTFINCFNEDVGGAIYKSNNIDNCTFINCFNEDVGGGAIARSNNITNCNFINCSCKEYSGGAIYNSNNISNCSFVGCYAPGGGAIAKSNNIFNCCFVNCSSKEQFTYGGAITDSNNIVSCSFVNCSVIDHGGAIGNSNYILNCSFVNCSDGAVYDSMNIYYCTFVNCSAYDGGAIYFWWDYTFDIVNCCFVNCSAYDGGAIYMFERCNPTIINCTFVNCYADSGGAIFMDADCNSTIINSSFVNCSSLGSVDYYQKRSFDEIHTYYIGGRGGAIFSYSDTIFDIVDCSFVNCSALKYDVNMFDSNVDHRHPIWDLDVAKGYGGAIYVVGCVGNITNCIFSGNEADDSPNYKGTFSLDNNIFEKANSYIHLQNTTVDYDDEYIIYLDTRGVDSVNANIVGYNDAVVKFEEDTGLIKWGFNGFRFEEITVYIHNPKLIIYNLTAGTYTLNITTVPKENFTAVNRLVNITINKVNSSLDLNDNITFGYGDIGYLDIDVVGAKSVVAQVFGHDEAKIISDLNNITIQGLMVGNYILAVTTVPDEAHYAVTKYVNVIVTKSKPNLTIVAKDIFYGESTNITVNLDVDANVTLELNGQNYTKPLSGGKAVFNISRLKIGTYGVKVTFLGNENYCSYSISDSFEVSKVTIYSITYSRKIKSDTYNIKLLDDATGTVTIIINKRQYSASLVKGKASFNLSKLSNGDYTYKLIYSGDDKYYGFTKTSITLTINRTNVGTITPDISIPPLENVSAGENVPVSLPSDAGGTVTLTINGTDYTFKVSNGKADVKLPDLSNGDYSYTIRYSGDSKYSSLTSSGSLKVNNTAVEPIDNTTNTNNTNATGNNTSNTTKPTPEIVVPPLDKPSADGSVTITLPSDATGKVTLTINGKDYDYTVENGVAKVIIPDVGEGNYPYTITYSGDSKYSSFTNNGSLKVNKTNVTPVENQTGNNTTVVDNSKIVASNVKVVYSAGSYYTITVYGTNGELADGETVKVTGKISKSLTTTNGVARFKVTNVPGTYKMNITALGKSVVKTLTVKHLVTIKSVTVKRSAKKLTLQATLGKVNGKYLKNKKITFKFNGKKYTAKTDKKGVAKVTIKSSILKKLKVGKKVTYQATYSKDTVKKTVKVKK